MYYILYQIFPMQCQQNCEQYILQEGVNDIHRFWHGQQLSDFASAEVVGPGTTAEAGAEDVNINYAGEEGKNMVAEAAHKGSKQQKPAKKLCNKFRENDWS